MFRTARARLLVAILGMLGACFEQPVASGDTGDECTPGAAGCPCADGVCLQGLECRAIGCVDPQCVDGTLDCPCLPAGGCDDGLTCAEGFCKVPAPVGTGTASATQGPADDTSVPTGASVDDGVTPGPGPTTTGPGMTTDDGPAPDCNMKSPCADPGDLCGDGMCQPSGPYGPCALGCRNDTNCVDDMSNMANACSPTCVSVSDCPVAPGSLSTVCADGQWCFLPCTPGVPGTCPHPMQCVLASTISEPSVCMWPIAM